MLKIRILMLFFLFSITDFFAQEAFFTHSLNENIRTIQVYNSMDVMSYPVITLNSNETITISFDELADNEQTLRYQIIHCNSDWKPSYLLTSEYLNGFKTSFIDQYDYSFNTNIPYVNYKITLPNNNTSLKVSGNYAVKVTKEDNDVALLYACFYISENIITLRPDIQFVTETDIKQENQQINFTLLHPGLSITDPNNDITIFIQQNNRRDNMIVKPQPTYIHPERIIYEQNKALIFKGGNEFRYFEATSTRYNTHGIERIQYYAPYYHMVLVPDEPQSKLNYNYHHDVNGKFFIRKQEADQNNLDLEADYVFVHFTFPAEDPFFNGRIYLNGEFTHNQYTKEYEMTYDFNEKAYYTNLLLKQGRYDYQYLFLPTGKTVATYKPFENNFFETENDYQIFCYFRTFNDRYDRLIGYKLATSNAK